MIPTFMLQTDPQYWAEPQKFDPDRYGDDIHVDTITCCSVGYYIIPITMEVLLLHENLRMHVS